MFLSISETQNNPLSMYSPPADPLRQAVESKDVDAITHLLENSDVDVTVVQQLCIELVKKPRDNAVNLVLQALTTFKGFSRDAVPSFVTKMNVDDGLILLKFFLKDGRTAPKIAEEDQAYCPL